MPPATKQLRHVVKTKFPGNPEVTHSISLGAGVQSTTMYLMAGRGLITPTPALAIFADTGWEPPDVYQHLDWLHQMSELMPHPIPIHRVSAGNLYDNVWNGKRVSGDHPWTDLPTFTVNDEGEMGMSSRQCTQNYKILPIIRRLRDAIGRPSGQRHHLPPFATQWIGISIDEWPRMKNARDGWIENIHPLVDMKLTRRDCMRWFKDQYPGRTLAKSACVGCPYHSNQEWLRIYRKFPEAAQKAVALDHHLRTPERRRFEPNKTTQQYLHHSRRPLDEALEKLEYLDNLQPRLLEALGQEPGSALECGGYCFT